MVPPTEPVAWFLFQVGFTICHQLADRSLTVDGIQYPIDARMSGIFLAFFVVALYLWGMGRFGRLRMPDRWVVAVAMVGSIAMALDAGSSYAHLRPTTNILRLSTGLAFGAGMGFVIPPMAALVERGGDLGKSPAVPVATWRDLPLTYGLVLLVGTLLYGLTTGLTVYYVFSTAIIVAYLGGLYIVLRMLVGMTVVPKYPVLADPRRRFAVTVACQLGFLTLFWVGHYLAEFRLGLM